MNKYIKTSLVWISFFIYTNAAKAADDSSSASDRYIYIGSEYGISDPIIKSFRDKESDTLMRLKKSHMYGGKIGYSFYPNMMVEISATHQPKYRLAYKLPSQSLESIMPGLSIPETPGTTRIIANVVTLNLIYEMQAMSPLVIKPYAIFGLGMARIAVKPTVSNWKMPALLGGKEVPYFKIKKTRQNCLAWQAGLGFNRDLVKNFSIDLSAKMQVVNDIRIKPQTLNMNTKSFDNAKPIKKTIGVGEFTVGLTYKIPLS